LHVDRDQNCHSDAKTIAQGRYYLDDIGGQVVFMLAPHSQYCPQQARELAQALGVEALLSPAAADGRFTTVDAGGHLDHRGAVAFTAFLLSALEQSESFRKALIPERRDSDSSWPRSVATPIAKSFNISM
jgi:hypothetical protein